jgi:hypothetical protein
MILHHARIEEKRRVKQRTKVKGHVPAKLREARDFIVAPFLGQQ